jgi:hypothetical protein
MPEPISIKLGMYIVTCRLKAGIVEPEEMSIARQRLDKHVPAEMYAHATID